MKLLNSFQTIMSNFDLLSRIVLAPALREIKARAEMNEEEEPEYGFREMPSEILLMIFKKLDGDDLLSVRKVCIQWGRVVQTYFNDDKFWKDLCHKNFRYVYMESRRRSNLSWREVYNSLYIWPEVYCAKVRVRVLDTMEMETTEYHFLENNVISCPHRRSWNCPANRRDCFVHYNLNTLQPVAKVLTPVPFDCFYEDDDMRVYDYFIVDRSKTMLRIIPKSEPHNFYDEPIVTNSRWIVFLGNIYYQAMSVSGVYISVNVYRMKIKKYNEVFFNRVDLFQCKEVGPIEEMGKENATRTIFMLRSTMPIPGKPSSLLVAEIDNDCFQEEYALTDVDDYLTDALRTCGFNWASKNVLKFFYKDPKKGQKITRQRVYSALVYHNYVFIASKKYPVEIQIYYAPMMPDPEVLLSTTPMKVIELEDYYTTPVIERRIARLKSMEVVEIVGGHRIVALYSGKVILIELFHPTELECAKLECQEQVEYFADEPGPRYYNNYPVYYVRMNTDGRCTRWKAATVQDICNEWGSDAVPTFEVPLVMPFEEPHVLVQRLRDSTFYNLHLVKKVGEAIKVVT